VSVLVVGISHNSDPVSLLERVALPADGSVQKLVQAVSHCEHVTEATVISTCNRLEIYADVDRFHGSVEELSRLLVHRAGESTESLVPHLYVHYADGAVSHLGSYGTRGVGYDVEYLRYQIAREIGLTQDWPVVIVGIGNLGHALANYSGFSSRGFRTVALLDADEARQGELVAGLKIRPFTELSAIVREHGVAIGVIATPAVAAQDVADRMVASGITSILNFAPSVLSVPEGVDVRKVDLSIELQILAYHEQRKGPVRNREETA
jgi:redox-sensing transcriptional repressor